MSFHAATHTASQLASRGETLMHRFADAHAVNVLRIALGFVFILFGALKFFPGLSPAQAIAEATTTKLTFGLLPAQTLLYGVAIVEVAVGLMLVANRLMRFARWLLAIEMVAILSPLVLLTGDLFSGPHGLPNLLGQYILKDFVLLGAVLVLFSARKPTATQIEPAAAPAESEDAQAATATARPAKASTPIPVMDTVDACPPQQRHPRTLRRRPTAGAVRTAASSQASVPQSRGSSR